MEAGSAIINYKYYYKSGIYVCIGSGGVIRNYNHQNFLEIFFDYDSSKRARKIID